MTPPLPTFSSAMHSASADDNTNHTTFYNELRILQSTMTPQDIEEWQRQEEGVHYDDEPQAAARTTDSDPEANNNNIIHSTNLNSTMEHDELMLLQAMAQDMEAHQVIVDSDSIAPLEEDESNKEEAPVLSICGFLWYKLCAKYWLPPLMVAGVTIGIMIAAGYQFDKNQLPQFVQDSIFDRQSGGFDNSSEAPSSLPKWDTNTRDGALQLEILNQLDDSWQPYLTQTLDDWNQDTSLLELTATNMEVDPQCDFVRTKIVMCNGDYGPTDFEGMNYVIVVAGNVIVASLAKLNEYYMRNANEARKEYTICHELGHALGLPHSDEGFFNINFGNCMDYTNRPWSNRRPDQNTFDFLDKMYRPADDVSDASPLLVERGEDDDLNDDLLPSEAVMKTRTYSSSQPTKNKSVLPDWVLLSARDAAANLEGNFAAGFSKHTGHENNTSYLSQKWIPLHHEGGDDKTASFQFDLGDGYSLQTHFLLANR